MRTNASDKNVRKGRLDTYIKLKRIILLILAILVLLSITYMLKIVIDKNIAMRQDKEVQQALGNANIPNSTSNEKTEKMLKLEELQKENEDIKAWIEIEGTSINYPVLQGNDNDYYMTHDYKKENTTNGSIFLDKDYDWEKPSTNLLMYGHNNNNNTMFYELLKYKDESFYKEHPTIKIVTNAEEAEYEIIAAFYSKVYYVTDTNVFRYYYFIDAENASEFNEFVINSKKASIYDCRKNRYVWRPTSDLVYMFLSYRRW